MPTTEAMRAFGLDPELVGLYLTTLVLALPRLTVVIFVLPAFGRFELGGVLVSGVAVALALPLVPALLPEVALAGLSLGQLAAVVVKEAILGLLLGLAFGLPFWAIALAGDAMDVQRGSMNSMGADPTGQSQNSVLGEFFLLTFTAFFFVQGGMLLVLDGLYGSYRVWPATSLAPGFEPADAGPALALLDRLFEIGFVYAAPFLIAMFVAEATLALVTRYAPQLNVFILAMPIKCGVVFLLLPLYLVFLFDYLREDVASLSTAVEGLRTFLP